VLGIAALVGGAVAGTLAMYLLDPEHGQDRRTRARETARRAMEHSGDIARDVYGKTSHALGDAWETVHDKVTETGAAAYKAIPSAQHLHDGLQNGGHRLMERARDAAGSAGSRVSDAAHVLSQTAHSLIDSARQRLTRRTPHLERHSDYAMNPAGVTGAVLGALALGAGAMWLFDPAKGRARRAWLGQKANRVVHEVGDFSAATGRHLRNKAKGYYCETASAVSNLATDVKSRFE